MKLPVLIILSFIAFPAFANPNDSLISFLNVTKKDDLIILAKVISFPGFNTLKDITPKTMEVEVIEVLKGSTDKKQITIIGADSSGSELTYLIGYNIGETYIFSLSNFKLLAKGNHSLNFKENIVKGNISNEPTSKYIREFNKLYKEVMELQLKLMGTTKSKEKYERLRKKFIEKSESLDQTVTYNEFKQLLEKSISN